MGGDSRKANCVGDSPFCGDVSNHLSGGNSEFASMLRTPNKKLLSRVSL